MEKSTKIGIITGVASSLLVMYLIDPILRIFGDFLYFILNGLSASFWDSLYTKAALGVPKDPSLIIFSMATGVLTGISAGILTAALKKSKTISNQPKPNPDTKRIPKAYVVTLAASLFFLVLSSFYYTWLLQLQYQVTTSFEQHIKIVKPYISTQEEDLLVSRFSLMASEKEFQELYRDLNAIAAKNNFKLPENPSYSFWSM
jgi:hypothetical protein